MDDPAETRSAAPLHPGLRELPPYLVAGNRFGSYGFGAGLSGLREAHETVNAARNRSSATSGSPEAQPSSPTTPS